MNTASTLTAVQGKGTARSLYLWANRSKNRSVERTDSIFKEFQSLIHVSLPLKDVP